MKSLLPALTISVGLCPALWAQEPEPVRIVATPASEPSPALRYALLPDLLEIEQGNAGEAYGRAALISAEVPDEQIEALYELMEGPLAETDLSRAHSILGAVKDVVHYTAIAARREPVAWDLPMEETFRMLLPELAHLRQAAMALALQARVEIAEGHFDDALATISTGMALARDLGEARTLIHSLVGVAAAGMMMDRVEELIAAPASQNLYWALTALPDPPVSLARGLETESHVLALMHPALEDPLNADLSPAQWEGVVREVFAAGMAEYGGPVPAGTGIALIAYTDAKRYLIRERHIEPERVDEMPVLQAVAVYMVDGFERVSGDVFKWYYVDYPEMARFAPDTEAIVTEAARRKDGFLPALLMPALSRAHMEEIRLQRRVEALRIVEALRMYAADHGGALPDSLDDVGRVPIPDDPATGQPFSYRAEDGTAILSAPALDWRPETALRYELTIAAEEGRER